METFDKFWYLLPKKDADVYFELRNYLEDPGCETDIARLFKSSTNRYILSNLLEHPYPMCQIIRCFPSSIYMQLFYEALQLFVDLTPEQLSANKSNLLSFLVNAQLSDKVLEKCLTNELSTIFRKIDTDEYYELPLALLASKSMPLVKAYNHFVDHSYDVNPYTKRTAFFMAINRSSHFFESIVQDGSEIVESDFIKNISPMIKLAILISNKPTRPSNDFNFYGEVWKLFKQIDATKMTDNQKIFYDEFARMLSLHHFVRSNRKYEYLSDSIALKVLASKYNILDFFVKFNEGSMIMNTNDYHLVRKQLVENGIFNQSINSNIQKDRAKASEVNLYDQFYTIYLTVKVILLRPTTRNYDDIVRSKSAEVKQIIDNIDDSFDYIDAVEYLFTLLFLRWEHINSRVFSNGKLENVTSATTNESDSSIEMNETSSTKRAQTKSNVKSGFACSFTVLQNMLSALSGSLVNRKIDDLDDELKQRFTRISSAIDDAKWRLQLVDLYYTAKNHLRLPNNLKVALSSHHKQVYVKVIQSSSDEETESKTAPVTRRKPRRQKSSKSSKSSSSGKKSSRSGKSDTFANSTEVEGKTKTEFMNEDISVIRYTNYRDRRGFVTKMLGQLTDMVAVCVIRGDLNAAKGIIEAHNLTDSAIASEVQLLAKYNELKTKLLECVKTIPRAPCTRIDMVYSIGEIKNMVVAGFESAQIITLLEEFIETRPIEETEDTKIILDRFAQNYMYLELYKGLALQGVMIADYALSLNANSDVCTNIVNLLSKCWDKKSDPIELYHDRIGYYGALRHILSTLTLFNTHREQFISIQELLATQLYTFDASEVSLKLQQEATFIKQKEVTLNMLATRPGLIENIIKFDVYGQRNENLLQNVFTYAMNMNRLLRLKKLFQMDANRTCLEEILEIDLFSLIGDIMFDEDANVSLKEIEATVCNLNTNLLHVITRNTCPIISICNKFNSSLEDELYEIQLLITNIDENSTSNESKQEKPLLRKPFKIKRHDVLHYVRNHNELIAYILGKIHGIELEANEKPKMQLNRTLIDNIMQMEEINVRTESDEESDRMLAALNFDSFSLTMVRQHIEQKNYRFALRLLQYSQERHLKSHRQTIQSIIDVLIAKILDDDNENASDGKIFSLIENIMDLQLMATTLLKHINRISDDDLALHLIRTILQHNRVDEVPTDLIEQLTKYSSDIILYANIGRAITITDFTYDTWTKITEINRVAPERLLHSLIERNQYELCYEWIENTTASLHNAVMKQQFIDMFLTKITDNRDNSNEYFIKVCKVILKEMISQMDSGLLLKLRNRKLLQYLVDHLIDNSDHNNLIYKNYKITLSIFDIIDAKEVNALWELAEEPLLIIEQYILNSKFETLSNILRTIRPLVRENECLICSPSPKMDATIEINTNVQSNRQTMDEFNGNYYHERHATSVQCIDLILRTYAAKALDFRIGNGSVISEDPSPNISTSMDSVCGTFSMPREAPDKSHWIKDIEATHCMCCKRSVFTMLTRRHHCRRCGRVVCHTCSTKRLKVPKLYENLLVRVCDDCFQQTNELQNIDTPHASLAPSVLPTNELEEKPAEQPASTRDGWLYKFTGYPKHDNLLREEFSFEYAPSASLCLNLISMHTPGQECCDFLLNYCKKFEALLKPLKPGHSNPEVDYAFVTRILYCLSFAAKVHGGNSECMKIRDHAEIINAVVRNGCESLLPMEPINMKCLRTLRDNLVVAEKFGLAIEISLKSGLQKSGIMAAWGIACIKAGCFEMAREKLVHCLLRTTCDEDRRQIIHFLTTDEKNQKPFTFKSTVRSPKVQPLLSEILCILETTCHPLNSDVLHRASSISQSNRSLSFVRFNKKEKVPIQEPAVNILHTLSNLKQISHGKYSVKTHRTLGLAGVENMNSLFASDSEQHGLHSRFYTESIYYLVSYGRHNDILRFLVKYKQVSKALKYALFLEIPVDQFIQTIIVPHLKSGRLNVIIQQMIDMDETLVMWKEYIIQICLMLEKRNLLNSLYQVQLLLKDTIRASMTCVRFYTIDSVTYHDLRCNAHHLMNAQQHLKSELELCQWEEIKNLTKRTDENQSFVMKMDPKSLNQHINTIWLQLDASKFLAQCEENGRETISLIPKISLLPCAHIPTLFENTQDKIILVTLILICGANVEEGFGLAYRIIQDMNLNSDKIYAIATKYLAVTNRLQDVEKLVNCIKSNSNQLETKLCNDILSLAVQSAFNNHATQQRTKAAAETLIRMITDVSMQIDCHILSGQLKAAYLLAVQHKRVADIRRILRYAEKTNQIQIKKLCEKKLQSIDGQDSQSSEH